MARVEAEIIKDNCTEEEVSSKLRNNKESFAAGKLHINEVN
jgi:hypothetical protein